MSLYIALSYLYVVRIYVYTLCKNVNSYELIKSATEQGFIYKQTREWSVTKQIFIYNKKIMNCYRARVYFPQKKT